MTCSSQSSRPSLPHYIRWTVQTMKFLIVSPLHSPFASLLGPNIGLRILFSNTLSLDSSLNVRDHAKHPYSTTGNIIVLYILIFKFLERSLEDHLEAINYLDLYLCMGNKDVHYCKLFTWMAIKQVCQVKIEQYIKIQQQTKTFFLTISVRVLDQKLSLLFHSPLNMLHKRSITTAVHSNKSYKNLASSIYITHFYVSRTQTCIESGFST